MNNNDVQESSDDDGKQKNGDVSISGATVEMCHAKEPRGPLGRHDEDYDGDPVGTM